jgi:hypothetical protein
LDFSSFQGSKSKIIAPLLIVPGRCPNAGPEGRVGYGDPICADPVGVSLAHITGLEQVFV